MTKPLDQVNPEEDIEPVFSPRFKRTFGKGLRKLIGATVSPLLLAGLFNAISYGFTKSGLEFGQYNIKELREKGLTRFQEGVNPEDMHKLDKGAYHLLNFIEYISRPGTELACRHYENNLEPHNID